jgi:hypothetical protein
MHLVGGTKETMKHPHQDRFCLFQDLSLHMAVGTKKKLETPVRIAYVPVEI